MAKNISLLGADYPDVPAVQLPQTGGGTATFYDIDITPHAVQYDIQNGFSLESWGEINIQVVGNLLVINIGGLKSANVVSSDTACIKLKNFTFTRAGAAFGVVWQSNNTVGVAMMYDNSGNIFVTRIGTAGNVMDFNMVVPLSSYQFT